MEQKSPSRRKDLTGCRFGRLVVVCESHKTSRGRWFWLCRCDCGKESRVQPHYLLSGRIKSCGCKRASGIHSATHRLTGTWVYYTYRGMISRCTSPSDRAFKNYGGRGIKVCDRWLSGEGGLLGVQCFYLDMGDKPSSKHSLERIDVNGDYSKENCTWVPIGAQTKNTRANRRITIFGETRILSEWAAQYGVRPGMIGRRLAKGWPPELAVTTPSRASVRPA